MALAWRSAVLRRLVAPALVALICVPVLAQEDKGSPDEVTTGEVRVHMNTQFAKLRIDGQEWENHEFVDNGRTLVVYGVDRTVQHKVELQPVDPGFEPVTITIAPKDWKLVRVKRRLRVWRVVKKVKFPKQSKQKKNQKKKEPAKQNAK